MALLFPLSALLLCLSVTNVASFAPSIDLPTSSPEPTSTTQDPETLPYFPGGINSTTISVPLGRAVVMPCRVKRLGDRVVSWVKKDQEKLHLITFGTNTYVSSRRFSLFHENPDTWELEISPVIEEDSGEYVCQVSVHPPISFSVKLSVTVPILKIMDGRNTPLSEKFYEVGSSIDLQCVASSLPDDVKPVWVKTGVGKIPASDTGTFNDTESSLSLGEDESRTWLKISSAVKNDSGEYFCTAGDATKLAMRVHVLEGEDSVAMQHSTNGVEGFSASSTLLLCAASYLFFLSSALTNHLMETFSMILSGVIEGTSNFTRLFAVLEELLSFVKLNSFCNWSGKTGSVNSFSYTSSSLH